MEGSVYRAGDTVRVTLQLIQADQDVHLWSETYERNVADVATLFGIQADIAHNVALALEVELSPGERARFAQQPTQSTEAYELYLAALATQGASAPATLRTLELVDQALALDPGFAEAWVLKANSHTVAQSWFPGDSASHQAAGGQAARRAIELNPELPQAHAAHGYALFQTREWIESEAAFRKARAMNMPLGDMVAYSGLLMAVGNFTDARSTLMEHRAIAPRNSIALSFLIRASALLGQWQTATQLYALGKRLFAPWTYHDPIMVHLLAGRGDLAGVRAIGAGEGSVTAAVLPNLEARETALRDLARMAADAGFSDGVSQLHIALWAAYFGDAGLALGAMRASTSRSGGNIHYAWFPQFDAVRRTPEFKRLLRDLGIVEYWRTYGWQDVCQPVGTDDFECTWVSPR
jgi:tetratricopeptide (TPR) repeat protein